MAIANLFLLATACMLIARQMADQAGAFLREHHEAPVNRWLRLTVIILFSVLVCILLSLRTANELTPGDVIKIILLFTWGIPMVLLDLHCYWLPQRFTGGFWLSGLLLATVHDSRLSLFAALYSSASVFVCLLIFRAAVNRLRREERMGLGDVHLIAGLAAWFGWPLACLMSAFAFFLLFLGAVICRRHVMPYAPWLFALMAGYAMVFPQLLSGDAYDFLFSLPR
ncbi:prepilin peptidase [Enterobacter hormaechei]|nr:prepilin peptidase [Enterobacter hormaechei]EKS6646230.1 prepilin peptidase [Enterobacter hormaechei]